MNDLNRKPRVGLLLISPPRFRDLGEGTARGPYSSRKEAESLKILAAASSFADVVFPGIVYTRGDVCAAMKRFYAEEADMVLAVFLSWSDDFAWIRFLRDMPAVPVLFAHIVRDRLGFKDSIGEDDFIEFLSAGGLVGALEASGSGRRFARSMFRTAIGTLEEVMAEASRMAAAAKLRSLLARSFFGLLPSYNEVMWSTYVDPYNLFMKAGPELRFVSVCALEDEVEAMDPDAVNKASEALLAAYRADGEFERDKFQASVRASLALESLARKENLDMVVLNDIDPVLFRRLGLRPGFTPSPGAGGVMVVPEGDVGCALACYALKALTGGHVNFVEPFHIDREKGLFAAGHAGPNDYTDGRGATLISRDARFAKSAYKYAGAPFAWHVIPPGEKTFAHISECNGRFKLICGVADALECEHTLAGYTHGLFRSRIPADKFFGKLMELGVTQHYGVVEGDCTAELERFAGIMDFDYTLL